jgi:hypothetical protein
MAPKVVAPFDLNLYILVVFMDHVQTKNDNYQPQHEIFLDIYIFSDVHLSSTTTKHLSQKTLKPKCDDKNYKKFKISNLKVK